MMRRCEFSIAHQWRKNAAPLLNLAYSHWHGAKCAPLAKTNGALTAQWRTRRGRGFKLLADSRPEPRFGEFFTIAKLDYPG